MKRNVDLKEISDGRLYSSGDMVRADCRDCEGCSECCRGMGSSIILDPMDVWRLQKGRPARSWTVRGGVPYMTAVRGCAAFSLWDGIMKKMVSGILSRSTNAGNRTEAR